jgi:hypothetical protein
VLAPSLGRAELLLVDRTVLVLGCRRARVLAADSVVLEGRLTGAVGPVQAAAVAIQSQGRTLATATTAEDGTFVARLPARDLPAGRSSVVARYDSPLRVRTSAESAEVPIFVARPEPLSPFVLGAAALAAGCLIALILLLTRRKGRRRDDAQQLASNEPVSSGVTVDGRRSRRPGSREVLDVAGVVRDAVEDCPVRDAELVFRGPDGVRTVRTDARGAFSSGPLAAGQHWVEVRAVGYVPERFAVTIPNDGSARHLRVLVVQVRHRALEAYRRTATAFLPRPGLWGYWTPRELAVHAVGQHPGLADALAALTSAFEQLYYSGVPGSAADLEQVWAAAAAVRQIQGTGRLSPEPGRVDSGS